MKIAIWNNRIRREFLYEPQLRDSRRRGSNFRRQRIRWAGVRFHYGGSPARHGQAERGPRICKADNKQISTFMNTSIESIRARKSQLKKKMIENAIDTTPFFNF